MSCAEKSLPHEMCIVMNEIRNFIVSIQKLVRCGNFSSKQKQKHRQDTIDSGNCEQTTLLQELYVMHFNLDSLLHTILARQRQRIRVSNQSSENQSNRTSSKNSATTHALDVSDVSYFSTSENFEESLRSALELNGQLNIEDDEIAQFADRTYPFRAVKEKEDSWMKRQSLPARLDSSMSSTIPFDHSNEEDFTFSDSQKAVFARAEELYERLTGRKIPDIIVPDFDSFAEELSSGNLNSTLITTQPEQETLEESADFWNVINQLKDSRNSSQKANTPKTEEESNEQSFKTPEESSLQQLVVRERRRLREQRATYSGSKGTHVRFLEYS